MIALLTYFLFELVLPIFYVTLNLYIATIYYEYNAALYLLIGNIALSILFISQQLIPKRIGDYMNKCQITGILLFFVQALNMIVLLTMVFFDLFKMGINAIMN